MSAYAPNEPLPAQYGAHFPVSKTGILDHVRRGEGARCAGQGEQQRGHPERAEPVEHRSEDALAHGRERHLLLPVSARPVRAFAHKTSSRRWTFHFGVDRIRSCDQRRLTPTVPSAKAATERATATECDQRQPPPPNCHAGGRGFESVAPGVAARRARALRRARTTQLAGQRRAAGRLLPSSGELARVKRAVRERAAERCESCGQPGVPVAATRPRSSRAWWLLLDIR